MLLINLIILAFLAWCAYRVIRMVIEAVKLAIRRAAFLEENFGFDIARAAKYTLGQPGPPGPGDGGPNQRGGQHDG